MAYIREAQPRAFILENVEGLLKMDGGALFDDVLHILRNVVRPRFHRVVYKLMNTAQHGIPQNRPRVYIIGIRHDFDGSAFKFPQRMPCAHIDEFLGPCQTPPDDSVMPPPRQTTARNNLPIVLAKIGPNAWTPLPKLTLRT